MALSQALLLALPAGVPASCFVDLALDLGLSTGIRWHVLSGIALSSGVYLLARTLRR
ncbi:MAG: hypothetical protein ACLQPH_10440 [Acidimicrobiales bacterium]